MIADGDASQAREAGGSIRSKAELIVHEIRHRSWFSYTYSNEKAVSLVEAILNDVRGR